jgi:chromosome partitioning protein
MMYRRTALAKEILLEIKTHFGDKVTQFVPVNVAIDEASAHGQPVVVYAPRATGARAFADIAQEILAHV